MSRQETTSFSAQTVALNGHIPAHNGSPQPETHPPKRSPFNLRAQRREMNTQYAMMTEGPNIGSILVRSVDPLTGWPTIHLASTEQLRKRHANRNVRMDGIKRNIFDLWLSHVERRDIRGIVFSPGQEVGEAYHNLWQGFAVAPRQGDCSLYLAHVRDVIASGHDDIYRYLIAWMADAVQHPGQRPGISLALRGLQGTGKGVFVSQFGKLFGPHYKHITQSKQLVGRFNKHLQDALLVFADEAFWAGDHQAEGTLKAMVTEEEHLIEPKGRDIYAVQNHIRLMIASNKEWLVPAGLEERRFCPIDVSDVHMQDEAYFQAIVEQMDNGGRAALLYHLLYEVDLSGVNLRHFPRTGALLDQIVHSMESVEQFWFNLLMQGRLYAYASAETLDWPDEVRIACPVLYAKYADFMGTSRQKVDEARFGSKLKELLPSGFRRYYPTINGLRTYAYIIPALAQCRTHFQSRVQAPITWPSVEEDADN
jgi:Family of unknown function (DUF5906)